MKKALRSSIVAIVLLAVLLLISCTAETEISDNGHSHISEISSPEDYDNYDEHSLSGVVVPLKEDNAVESEVSETEPCVPETEEQTSEFVPDDRTSYSKRVAFTFDDGPSRLYTPKILDIVEELDIGVSFFVLGCNVYEDDPLLKRMTELGCDVGNHSFNHKNFSNLTLEQIAEQIDSTNRLIESAIGKPAELLRPPYGEYSEELSQDVMMTAVFWSVDPEDWKYKDAGVISEHILSRVKSGDVVLLHDIYKTSAEAFDIVARKLVADGWELVTVSELFGFDGTQGAGMFYCNY